MTTDVGSFKSYQPHIHPTGWSTTMLSHPCAEETFVLAGEVIGERGALRAGAY